MSPSIISPSLSTQSLSLLRKAWMIVGSTSGGLAVPLAGPSSAEDPGRASAEELRDDWVSAESKEGEKGTEAASSARGLCIVGALALTASDAGCAGLEGAVAAVSVFVNVIAGRTDGGGGEDAGCCELCAPLLGRSRWSAREMGSAWPWATPPPPGGWRCTSPYARWVEDGQRRARCGPSARASSSWKLTVGHADCYAAVLCAAR